MALISEESGRHFDPKLAELFLDLIPEMAELREKFPDEDDSTESV